MSKRRRRSWLAWAFGLAAVSSYGAAQLLSSGGAAWQRAHEDQNYCLIPVNLLLFWFLPTFALSTLALAAFAGTRTRWLRCAMLCAVLFSGARALFWAGLAPDIGPHPRHERLKSVHDEHGGLSLLVSALGLSSWAALGVGLWAALKATEERAGNDPGVQGAG